MSLRLFLALVSAAAAVAALVMLATPITLDAMHQGGQIRCGSVLSPDRTTAAQADLVSAYTGGSADHNGECIAAAGQRKAWAIPALVVAGVVLVGVLVVRRRPINASG